MVRVCEIFRSIQGEGPSIGRPALFIRLSGCNLRCWFCDTKYSWSRSYSMSVEDVVDVIIKSPERLIVFTGGEPMLQASDVERIVLDVLRVDARDFEIETNGLIYYKFADGVKERVRVIVSPKDFAYPEARSTVVYNMRRLVEDGIGVCLKLLARPEWAREYVSGWIRDVRGLGVEIYVQPLHLGEDVDEMARMYRDLYEVLYDLDVYIRPQLHKMVRMM